MDIVDAATRSRMMAGIKGRDTRPEMVVRKQLHRLGFRFRLHRKGLPGRPDLVLARHRAVIFVHGCFWHRHEGCRLASTPSSNPEFWQAKFAANVARDEASLSCLHDAGWRTAVIWECGVKGSATGKTITALAGWLLGDQAVFESAVPVRYVRQER